MLAGGNTSVIKNLRREHGSKRAHPIENLLKVADVLDLEVLVVPRGARSTQHDFMAEDGADYDVKSAWVVPRMHEETGQGKKPTELALDRAWLEQRGLDPEAIVAARALVGGEVEGLDRGDLAIIDTSDLTLDGRAFAWFNGNMDRLRFGRLLQLPTGPTVVSLADGSPLQQLDRRAGMRVIGALVATFRPTQFPAGNDLNGVSR